MVRLKMIMLGLLLAAMSAVALIYQVAIDWYPPGGTAQDGQAVACAPADIRDCMGARAFAGLGDATSSGMLALLASAVGSPSLAESRERRIWIFADEFPQLPRLGHFSTFLDLGRSKGVITVIGAQDIAQLRATYGHERADGWAGMIGTKIITCINAGRGPSRVAISEAVATELRCCCWAWAKTYSN